MKTIRNFFLACWHLILLAVAIIYSVSCSTVTTEITTTDAKSGLVTTTRTITRRPDAAAMEAVTATAIAMAPRARVIREEKGSTDMGEILRTRKPQRITLTD